MQGAALVKVRNVELNTGLEAWRLLTRECEPRARGRQRHRLNQLLRPEKLASILGAVEALEKWEREVKEYERCFQKEFDEDVKIGVLSFLAPEKVADHLYMYADSVKTR
eukprot:640280-Amphidinium_carterae.2